MNSGAVSKKHRCLPLAALMILAACAPANGNSGSITVFLAESDNLDQLIPCDAGFAGNSNDKVPAIDGSHWTWVEDAAGQLSHYCLQRDGVVTAWDETAQNRPATHRLTFAANSGQAAFGPISLR